VCITFPLLRGTDGTRKMGKSLGNYIGVAETAYDMFAKTMSIPDDLLRDWFELLTDRRVDELSRLLVADRNPKDAKIALGKDIVTFYHGAAEAEAAAAEWDRRFSRREDPTEMEDKIVPLADTHAGRIGICKLLVLLGFAKSNNEARRYVQESAVTTGPERQKVTDPLSELAISADGVIVRVGKRKVARVRTG